MMTHNPPRYDIGQHGALEVLALALQYPSNRIYQRIEIVIDLPPEDTHRRSPFFQKNRNRLSLAVIADILQLPDLRGQAGLHARSEVHIGPRWCIALQHSHRGRAGFSHRLLRQRAALVLQRRVRPERKTSRPASKVAEAAQD